MSLTADFATSALLHGTPPPGSEAQVEALYQPIRKMLGTVPPALQMYAVSPPLLEDRIRYIRYFMEHPSLSKPLLAMLRLLVSQQQDCEYCVNMNKGFLLQAGLSLEQIAAMQADPAQAPLPDKEKALLLLVLKAVSQPLAVSAADLDPVRTLGWAERDIFEAIHHGAVMVSANILLNTFKIEGEGGMA